VKCENNLQHLDEDKNAKEAFIPPCISQVFRHFGRRCGDHFHMLPTRIYLAKQPTSAAAVSIRT